MSLQTCRDMYGSVPREGQAGLTIWRHAADMDVGEDMLLEDEESTEGTSSKLIMKLQRELEYLTMYWKKVG